MKTKICISCKKHHDISEFYSDGKGKRRPRCKVCHKERFENSPKDRWKKYARDAKRRGIQFDLSEKEFATFAGAPCFYCGGEVSPIRLDRIDNDLGYDVLNVVSCCYMCNSFKHSFKEGDFLRHVKRIYLYQKNKREEMNKIAQTLRLRDRM